jgi:hypothetical protein
LPQSVARWKKYESPLGELFAALPLRESTPIAIAAGNPVEREDRRDQTSAGPETR